MDPLLVFLLGFLVGELVMFVTVRLIIWRILFKAREVDSR